MTETTTQQTHGGATPRIRNRPTWVIDPETWAELEGMDRDDGTNVYDHVIRTGSWEYQTHTAHAMRAHLYGKGYAVVGEEAFGSGTLNVWGRPGDTRARGGSHRARCTTCGHRRDGDAVPLDGGDTCNCFLAELEQMQFEIEGEPYDAAQAAQDGDIWPDEARELAALAIGEVLVLGGGAGEAVTVTRVEDVAETVIDLEPGTTRVTLEFPR